MSQAILVCLRSLSHTLSELDKRSSGGAGSSAGKAAWLPTSVCSSPGTASPVRGAALPVIEADAFGCGAASLPSSGGAL